MATLTPFRALRPKPAEASRIAAVPYDVVSTDEARALADGNPLNFLRVSRAVIALGAQTGPVFLTYRASPDVDRIIDRVTSAGPLIDFEAADGVRHTLWRVGGADRDAIVVAYADIPVLYIADGHHRAASAARAREEVPDPPEAPSMPPGAFPHDQVHILSYNPS